MRTLAALVFPGFQTLDYFGPIEMLGDPTYEIEIVTVAETEGAVPSRHGQRIVPDTTMAERTAYDLLLVPGGDAALEEGARCRARRRPIAPTWRARRRACRR